MRLILDTETNGLLDELDRLHSLVLKDIDTGQVWSCSSETLDIKDTLAHTVLSQAYRILHPKEGLALTPLSRSSHEDSRFGAVQVMPESSCNKH